MDEARPRAARDALALLAHGLDIEAFSPLTGTPILAVDVADREAAAALAAHAASLPCVLVGIGDPANGMAPALDVLLTSRPDADPPWVSVPSTDVAMAALYGAVRAQPETAATLVHVLRVGRTLDVHDAVTLESLAYGVAQAGAGFRRWLASRPRRTPKVSAEPAVLLERHGDVVHVTLNRPEARNAYDVRLRDGLADAMRLVAADPAITEVHLRGAGPVFCSGGDLDEFGTAPDPMTSHLVRSTRGAAPYFARVGPRLVAYVHGACVGAGVELPAFARRVVADPATTFRLPEVSMGLIPGAGGTASLTRRIGWQRTAWLGLTGTMIDADTARQWGLVDEVAGHSG